MKNDDHHRFRVRLFECLFQQTPRDPRMTVVHLAAPHLVKVWRIRTGETGDSAL